jgi:hypothetical protein
VCKSAFTAAANACDRFVNKDREEVKKREWEREKKRESVVELKSPPMPTTIEPSLPRRDGAYILNVTKRACDNGEKEVARRARHAGLR